MKDEKEKENEEKENVKETEKAAAPEVVEGEGDEPAPDAGEPLLHVPAEGFRQGPRLRLQSGTL